MGRLPIGTTTVPLIAIAIPNGSEATTLAAFMMLVIMQSAVNAPSHAPRHGLFKRARPLIKYELASHSKPRGERVHELPNTYEQKVNSADDRDALTGVHGYYALLRDFDYAQYRGEDVYVVLCDLDNFRMLNEAYGEQGCDGVLREVGAALRRCFGDLHTYRYGSDEFIIVDTFPSEQAFLDKIKELDKCLDAISIGDSTLHMTCSYGCAHGTIANSDELHEAIRLADRKMFEAKRLGKNRVVIAPLAAQATTVGSRLRNSALKSYESDELTGLTNYIFFRRELTHLLAEQALKEDVAPADRIALVYFNVQNFKGYNQQFGFDAGDELLLLISDEIQKAYPNCLASRFSADQFMVVSTASTAEAGFKRVRSAFRKHRKDTSIWLRAGSYVPEDGADVGVCMDRAKMACDSIRGRRDVFYRAYDETLKAQIAMHRYVLDNFDQALSDGWIKPFYQPIVRVATGDVCDIEALSRWVDPLRGIISPADFIPVLEDARLIHRLDLHIVRQVCEDYRRVTDAGGHFVMPSVNLSRLDFELCDIVSEIRDITDAYGMPHNMLAIEVTESVLSGSREFLKSEIDRFRELGFQMWMDDFGSGYSSLNLLKEYQFDLIKLDMAFLRGFEGNEGARIIMSHIIGMAKELGFKTLVEGVETQEHYEFLREIGCGRAQGWHFGRPDMLENVMEAIRRDSSRSFETHDMHAFYEDVGRINLMRPIPAAPVDGHYATGDRPSAIIERMGGTYRFLNVSDTFARFLKSIGIASVEENERLFNDPTSNFDRLRSSVERTVATGQWDFSSYENEGHRCSVLTRCIARNEEHDAVAIFVVVIDSLVLDFSNEADGQTDPKKLGLV